MNKLKITPETLAGNILAKLPPDFASVRRLADFLINEPSDSPELARTLALLNRASGRRWLDALTLGELELIANRPALPGEAELALQVSHGRASAFKELTEDELQAILKL